MRPTCASQRSQPLRVNGNMINAGMLAMVTMTSGMSARPTISAREDPSWLGGMMLGGLIMAGPSELESSVDISKLPRAKTVAEETTVVALGWQRTPDASA
jgi:hypothetical protein